MINRYFFFKFFLCFKTAHSNQHEAMKSLVSDKISRILQGRDLKKKKLNGLPARVSPLVKRTKPPEPPGCLILEDLQTPNIPTNKKLEVWTQYRLLLSFLGGYFSSFKKMLRQREICTKILKSGKILRNHRYVFFPLFPLNSPFSINMKP